MALETPRRALRQAARELRHRVASSAGTSTATGTSTGPDTGTGTTTGTDPADLSAELERLRARLTKAEAKVARNKDQLAQMRARFRAALDLADADRLHDDLERTIAQVRTENLTFLRPAYLRDLAQVVLDLERDRVPGTIVEAGTALGGSAIVLAAAKSTARSMKVYDVFGRIPEPGERDGADVHKRYQRIASGEATGVGGDTYYGYRDDLYSEVTDSFARHGVGVDGHNVELVKGLFEDTIDLDEPVAMAHLDGDWYDSTMVCLQRLAPLLVPGGRIVLDDYYQWSGCRRAVDDYFAGRDEFEPQWRAKLHVVRR